jgi:hypothetical protein
MLGSVRELIQKGIDVVVKRGEVLDAGEPLPVSDSAIASQSG